MGSRVVEAVHWKYHGRSSSIGRATMIFFRLSCRCCCCCCFRVVMIRHSIVDPLRYRSCQRTFSRPGTARQSHEQLIVPQTTTTTTAVVVVVGRRRCCCCCCIILFVAVDEACCQCIVGVCHEFVHHHCDRVAAVEVAIIGG